MPAASSFAFAARKSARPRREWAFTISAAERGRGRVTPVITRACRTGSGGTVSGQAPFPSPPQGQEMRMKGILLWLIGIPIPIIILLYIFVFR